MTEAEWLTCTDPEQMLVWLTDNASERKLRLFAVACCRRVLDLARDQRSRNGVEIAERYADGVATAKELRFARTCAAEAWDFSRTAPAIWPPSMFAERACAHCACADDASFGGEIASSVRYARRNHGMLEGPAKEAAAVAERAAQVALQRDVMGNPLRPAVLDRPRLAPASVTLARTIYDERAFERLPELGDGLQKAGCTDQAILEHCRRPGSHVRGCWVVDLVLGRQ